jgi:hypothetical protein
MKPCNCGNKNKSVPVYNIDYNNNNSNFLGSSYIQNISKVNTINSFQPNQTNYFINPSNSHNFSKNNNIYENYKYNSYNPYALYNKKQQPNYYNIGKQIIRPDVPNYITKETINYFSENNNDNNINNINNQTVFNNNFNSNNFSRNYYNQNNNTNINNYNTYNNYNYKRPISQQTIEPKEMHQQLHDTWSLFPKYFLFFNSDNYKKGLDELVLLKKNFFLFMYGSHNYSGESWCSDCRKSEPFINKAKQLISSREKIKEIYFVSIPIDKEKKMEFYSNPICHMSRVPTLAYFEGGKEKGRIFEQQMQTQQMVDNFVEIAYMK